MSKFAYYFLFIAMSLALALAVKLTYVDIAVKQRGEIIRAKIEKINCHPRNANLYITHMNNEHSILIAHADCLKGKYHVGDSITVKALPEYRRTQFPNSNQFVAGVLIIILLPIWLILWIVARKEIMLYLSGKGNSKSG